MIGRLLAAALRVIVAPAAVAVAVAVSPSGIHDAAGQRHESGKQQHRRNQTRHDVLLSFLLEMPGWWQNAVEGARLCGPAMATDE